MPLISCPSCSAQYEVPDELIGRKVKCRQCGFKFLTGSGDDAGERTAELTAIPEKPDVTPPANPDVVMMELPGDIGPGGQEAVKKEEKKPAASERKPAAKQSGRSAAVADDDDEFAAALAAALAGEDESAPGKAAAGAGAPGGNDTFSDMGYGGTMALDSDASAQVTSEAKTPASASDSFDDESYGGTMVADDATTEAVQAATRKPSARQVVVPDDMRAQPEPDIADAEPATQMLPASRVASGPPMASAPAGGVPSGVLTLAVICLLVAIGLGVYAIVVKPMLDPAGAAGNAAANSDGTGGTDGNGKGPGNSAANTAPSGPLSGLDRLVAAGQESALDAIRRYESYRAQREALQAEFAARQEALVAAYLYKPGAGASGTAAWEKYQASADGLLREFDRARGQMANVVVEADGEVKTSGDTASATVRVQRWSFVTELGKPTLTRSQQTWRYSLARAGNGWEIVERTPVN